jgi:hypothetical protein
MRLLFTAIAALILIFCTGCTSVVNSVKPISLYQPNNTDYRVLDGLPYFLPSSRIHMDIVWSDAESNWIVTLTPAVIPDNAARYLLRPNANALFDDNITLTVDSNGLLQAVNATTTDKTVSSLADLVKTAGDVITFGAAMVPESPMLGKGPPKLTEVTPELRLFHPELRSFHKDYKPYPEASLPDGPVSFPDTPELTSPRIKIDDQRSYQFTAKFKLEIAPLTLSPPIKPIPMEPGETFDKIGEINSENATIHGIVVRILIPYKIIITETLTMTKITLIKTVKTETTKPLDTKAGNAETTDSVVTKECHRSSEPIPLTQNKILMLPDIKQDYIWPINRRYFVADQTTIGLKDGMITNFQQTKPSMVAGIVGIPKSILDALVPIPTLARNTQSTNLTYIDTSLKTKADIKNLQSK